MIAAGESRSICKVCHQQWSRYTCPRCNLQYCCLECYKKHGQQCTETFYRENAKEHLESVKATEAERQHMLTILRRVQQDEGQELATEQGTDAESDHEDNSDLGISDDLLKKLSVAHEHTDFEIHEEDLTSEELQAFKRAVASGRMNSLLSIWTPWWNLTEAAAVQLSVSGTNRVSVQNADTGDSAASVSNLPAAPSHPLPLLASLTKFAPSPLLQWQLLDILYTYCFVMRLYNGDYLTDPQEAVMTALQVSSTLEAAADSSKTKSCQSGTSDKQAAPPAVPISASEALLACAERVCSPAVAGSVGRSTATGLLHDVATMVKHGRSVVVLVLTDLQRLFAASQHVPSQKPASTAQKMPEMLQQQAQIALSANNQKGTSRIKRQAKGVSRKLNFLLSWANEMPASVYIEVLQSVVEELQQHAFVLPEHQEPDQNQLKLDTFVQSTLLNRPVSAQKS